MTAASSPCDIVLLCTGDTQSYLRPCGCQPTSPGGIARRVTLIRQLREHQPSPVLLDLGNLISTLPGTAADAELLVEFMYRSGYTASGLGPNELQLGRRLLEELTRKAKFHFVLTNPAPDSSLKRLRPSLLLDHEGSRIGILSLTEAPPTASGLAPLPPAEALSRTIGPLRAKADLVVLLSQLSLADLKKVLDEVPGIDLSVTTGRTANLVEPELYKGCWICSTPTLGRGITEIRLAWVKGKGITRLDAAQHMLGPEIAADPETDNRVTEHLRQRKIAMPNPPDPRLTAAIQAAIAASTNVAGSCQSCHSDQFKQWIATKHAAAWHTLVAKGSEKDVTCISCHTTPVLSLSPSQDLTGIGCATCHGSDDLHRTDPKQFSMARQPDASLCVTCHTPEMDPHFDFDTYLARVRH